MPTTPEQEEIIAQALEAFGGNVRDMMAHGHEVKRKKLHAKAKATRPALEIQLTEEDKRLLFDAITKELAEADRDSTEGAIDYLLLSARESILAGDVYHTIFDLVELFRRIWGINRRLGQIAPPKPEKAAANG